jgi:hypothetical protein
MQLPSQHGCVEERLTLPDDRRLKKDPKLVDEATPHQRTPGAGTEDGHVPARLTLDRGDGVVDAGDDA